MIAAKKTKSGGARLLVSHGGHATKAEQKNLSRNSGDHDAFNRWFFLLIAKTEKLSPLLFSRMLVTFFYLTSRFLKRRWKNKRENTGRARGMKIIIMGIDSLPKRAATAQMCKNHPANWAGKKGTIEPFTSTGRWRKKKRWFWKIWTVLHLFCYSRDQEIFWRYIFEMWESKSLHNSWRISDVASKMDIRPLHKKWKQVLGVEVGGHYSVTGDI